MKTKDLPYPCEEVCYNCLNEFEMTKTRQACPVCGKINSSCNTCKNQEYGACTGCVNGSNYVMNKNL
jgi:hypothetical protein